MILDPDQLKDLSEISRQIVRLQKFIDAINARSAETGLGLRPIATWPAALMGNDISQLTFSHQLALQQLRAQVIERMRKIQDEVTT